MPDPASARSDPADAPVITGLGLLTPLGHAAWPTIRALLEGRRTADRLAEMPGDVDPVVLARATASCAAAALAAEDPAIELADLAAREAIEDAAWARRFPVSDSGTEDSDAMLVVGASKGAVGPLFDTHDSQRRALCAALGPVGYLEVSLRKRLTGIASFGVSQAVASACSTSLAALHLAREAILAGRCERALVVSVEAALLPLFLLSYRRLGVLAPTSPPTAHVARPLDRAREGFTLCEVGVAVAMERSDLSVRAPRGHARVIGTALGSEAHDVVRAPARPRALKRVVARVASPSDPPISLLHPHAPGTISHDGSELCALEEAIGRDRARSIPVYASKGALGHPLGAAGLVNVALSALLMRVRLAPPMAWIEDPVETGFLIRREGGSLGEGEHVITAAGFGGHVGAAALGPVG
jgi:3-oxoacyl-[acyl-carrier-protein] synthase II